MDRQRIIQAIRGQNPWWIKYEGFERDLPPYPRFALARLKRTAMGEARPRGLLLYGPRRTGKTTLLRHCILDVLLQDRLSPRKVLYVDFEHPFLRDVNIEELIRVHSELHGKQPGLLLFDEIQRLTDWESWLKILADHGPDVPFIATGSAAIPLMKGSQESGAGRWEELELPPLLFSEYLALVEPRKAEIPVPPLSLRTVSGPPSDQVASAMEWARPMLEQHFPSYLIQGGFPGVVDPPSGKSAQSLIREEVIIRAVGRDLARDLGGGGVDDVERLFTYLAESTGQLISEPTLATMLGISRTTVSRYLGHLERAGLFWRAGRKAGVKGKVKAQRKGFISDSSLAAAALWQGDSVLLEPDRLGNLVETAVAANIRALAAKEGGRIYYWRDRKGREVDFFIDIPGTTPLVIETKYQRRYRPDFSEGLSALLRDYPEARAILLLPGSVSVHGAPDNIFVWPLEFFIAAVGEQLSRLQRNEKEEIK